MQFRTTLYKSANVFISMEMGVRQTCIQYIFNKYAIKKILILLFPMPPLNDFEIVLGDYDACGQLLVSEVSTIH